MGLYKRGQVWWMRFTYRGKQVRKPTETSDRKLAQRIYDKVRGEIARGKWFERLPSEDITFRELMERYLVDHSARNKALTTHRRDRSLADHLLQAFGHLTLPAITPPLIADYKSKRRAAGAAPKTVNNELILMSHAFTLARKEWEWVHENPVQKVSKEKVDNMMERWLTLEEERRLVEASIAWLRDIIVFALETGLRQSELLRLQWPQVDLFKRTMTLLVQKNRGKDTLPLSERAVEVLKARAKVRHLTSPYVFFNMKGNGIGSSNLLRAFYAARKKAKLENVRFHDLRHTFATRLIQEGVDLYTVQKLGRWKTISMVMRYAHHYPESLRPGVQALDAFRKRGSTNLAQEGNQAEAQAL